MTFDFRATFDASIAAVGAVYRGAKDAGFTGDVQSNTDGSATLRSGGVSVDYRLNRGVFELTDEGRVARAGNEAFPESFADPSRRARRR